MLHASAADASQDAGLPPSATASVHVLQQSEYVGPAAEQHQWVCVTGIAVIKGDLVPCNAAEQSVIGKRGLWCCSWSG